MKVTPPLAVAPFAHGMEPESLVFQLMNDNGIDFNP